MEKNKYVVLRRKVASLKGTGSTSSIKQGSSGAGGE
jgi:hypothetical protein